MDLVSRDLQLRQNVAHPAALGDLQLSGSIFAQAVEQAYLDFHHLADRKAICLPVSTLGARPALTGINHRRADNGGRNAA